MVNKNHKGDDDFSRTIRNVDELCREAERIRSRVENSLRNRAFYPDRRRHSRVGDYPSEPPRGPRGSDDPSKDSHAA
jgi:hypothetical protein